MKIRISTERNLITSLPFVIILNFVLFVLIVITSFNFIAIFTFLIIGSGFTYCHLNEKVLYVNDSFIFIENYKEEIEQIPVSSIKKICKGGILQGAYTMVYIDNNSVKKSTEFIPRSDGLWKNHEAFNDLFSKVSNNFNT